MRHYSIYQRLLKNVENLIDGNIIKAILIKKEEFDKLNKEKGIAVKDAYRQIILSPDLLKYILKDKLIYKLIKRRFKSNFDYIIRISSIDEEGNINDRIEVSKAALVKALKTIYENGYLNVQETKKYQELKEMVTYENFLTKKGNKEISHISYRGNYKTTISEVLNILSLPEKKLQGLLKTNNIAGMPKEEFLGCVKSIFDYGDALCQCLMPNQIMKNKEYLERNIDDTILFFETEETPPFTKNIVINEMLWEEMWDKVPKNFNDFEKAYYIYYQLCKIFTYDEEAMVSDITCEEITINHKNIMRLKDVNNQNSEVICFEFIAIYSKFLEELGLAYNITGGRTYGPNHLALEFAYDKYKVLVDSTKSIINGDMALAKRGGKLLGFSLSSDHTKETQSEFGLMIERVNEYIRQEENIDNTLISKKELSEELTEEERRQLLLDSIETSELGPTDIIGYILDMQSIIFPNDQKGKCQVCFIRDNNPPVLRNKQRGLATIICFNDDFTNFQTSTEYYLHRPGESIEKITKEKLQEKFDINEFAIIRNRLATNHPVPGINTEEKDKQEISIYTKRFSNTINSL